MEYEEILDELQVAIRGLEMNTQFFPYFCPHRNRVPARHECIIPN